MKTLSCLLLLLVGCAGLPYDNPKLGLTSEECRIGHNAPVGTIPRECAALPEYGF